MIRAIYLDLGRVLIDLDLSGAVTGLQRLTPWPLSQISSFLNGELIQDYESGKISTQEFHRSFCSRLGVEIPFTEFRRLWSEIFVPEPLLSEAFLQSLRQNYPLHLLSNTNELHMDFVMDRYPILRHFEELVLSFQVGWMKPQQEIYRIAVDRAGVAPNEIFFTDDRIENVEAAKAYGIQAVQFHSEAQLKQEMMSFGIHF